MPSYSFRVSFAPEEELVLADLPDRESAWYHAYRLARDLAERRPAAPLDLVVIGDDSGWPLEQLTLRELGCA